MRVRETFRCSLWAVEEGIVCQGGDKKGFLEAMATNLAFFKNYFNHWSSMFFCPLFSFQFSFNERKTEGSGKSSVGHSQLRQWLM